MKSNRWDKRAIIGIFSSASPITATVLIRYESGKIFRKQDFYPSGKLKNVQRNLLIRTTLDRLKEARDNAWLCIDPRVRRDRLIGGNLHTM